MRARPRSAPVVMGGRDFRPADVNPTVAIVNQAFAKQYLGDLDPIGQSVRSPMLKIDRPNLLSAQSPDDWLEVIGVVGDAKNDGLEHPVKPAIFLPYSFVLGPGQTYLVRASGDPETTIRSVKERLREINSEFVVDRDHTLSWWLETDGWGKERFIATLFSLFAVLALGLAATGLYAGWFHRDTGLAAGGGTHQENRRWQCFQVMPIPYRASRASRIQPAR